MAKLTHSVQIERLYDGKKEFKEFYLNGKEYLLYKALLDAKGEVIQVTKLCSDLEMELSHLRVTKRNLTRLLEGWADIKSLYGNGYSLRFMD